jgi:hypothetical protein
MNLNDFPGIVAAATRTLLSLNTGIGPCPDRHVAMSDCLLAKVLRSFFNPPNE